MDTASGRHRTRGVDGGEIDADLDVLMVPLPGSYSDELVAELESRGVSVETREGFFRILSGIYHEGVPDVVHLHFLGQFVSRTRYDTVLVPLLFGARLLVELLVAKALGVRLVWTVHNLYRHEAKHPRVERGFRHLTARLVDRLIVHCDTAADIIVDEYRLPPEIRAKIRTVPHGNYLPRYPDEIDDDEARRRLGVDDETRTLLYFGHIRWYKNVDGLIETFKRIDDPDAELLVVGNPFDDEIEATVSSLAAGDDRIRTVLEFVPDEEIQTYMRAADVVVLPFNDVLTSGSLILGMTFERPVVAPDTGCAGELLDEAGGFPYDPADPDGLERSLRSALDADLSGMGAYNFETVEPLDWSWIGRRTVEIYTE
ncbi:glycosyltransferase [Haloarcula litorea]|uniref:glycosyltransferase n=1 Tax=Haloarcula litorea TaxID=3032579 RepID=UPI0023E7F569|nr:glycosyltransferase [Halomicroarcula sp. GDY20]